VNKLDKKRQRKIDERKTAKNPAKRIIKTSIIIVGIFIIIIAAALIKEFYFDSHPKITESQMNSAKLAVENALQSKGDGISNYQYSFSKKIKNIGHDENSIPTIQLSLCNNSTKQTFLINLDTQEIIMHSEVDYYTNYPNKEKDKGCSKEDLCRNDFER
jgi:hypothetical protein